MENQDFNQELMNYLYDEMSPAERIAFEKKMDNDPDLKSEYEELRGVREQLGLLTDKEVMEPISAWGKSNKLPKSGTKHISLRPLISIAATLLIMMVLGYLMDFSISLNKEGFYLGFNKTSDESSDNLGKQEIQAMLSDAIEKNNRQILATVGDADSAFQTKFTSLEQKVSDEINRTNSKNTNTKELQVFLTKLEKQNAEVVKGYLKLSAVQQQEYFKTVLTQFNEYMQEQRKEDLVMIQNNLIELKQTQSYQKKETDQVLAGLISTINYKNKN